MSNRAHNQDVTGKNKADGTPGTETFKQFDAETRALARANRTPEEQLAVLNARLGAGVGAVKERTRLLTQLATA